MVLLASCANALDASRSLTVVHEENFTPSAAVWQAPCFLLEQRTERNRARTPIGYKRRVPIVVQKQTARRFALFGGKKDLKHQISDFRRFTHLYLRFGSPALPQRTHIWYPCSALSLSLPPSPHPSNSSPQRQLTNDEEDRFDWSLLRGFIAVSFHGSFRRPRGTSSSLLLVEVSGLIVSLHRRRCRRHRGHKAGEKKGSRRHGVRRGRDSCLMGGI